MQSSLPCILDPVEHDHRHCWNRTSRPGPSSTNVRLLEQPDPRSRP